jgi:hypothetical protein
MKNLFGAGSGRKAKKRSHHSVSPGQTRQNLPASWFARFTLKNSTLFVLLSGAAGILTALVASFYLHMLFDSSSPVGSLGLAISAPAEIDLDFRDKLPIIAEISCTVERLSQVNRNSTTVLVAVREEDGTVFAGPAILPPPGRQPMDDWDEIGPPKGLRGLSPDFILIDVVQLDARRALGLPWEAATYRIARGMGLDVEHGTRPAERQESLISLAEAVLRGRQERHVPGLHAYCR